MVPPLCIGTAPLGDLPNFDYEVGEERAVATARAVFAGSVQFADTAAGYRESERRLGIALRERGGLPPGFVLGTKVGCDFPPGDPGGDHVRRSIDRSLRLLGLGRLQLVFLHDPEDTTFEHAMAPGGPVEALQKCKDAGLIEHIGVAGGRIETMHRYVQTRAFEVLITHNRYTLLNVAANPLLDLAVQMGVASLNGAPYGGGILSKGATSVPRYAYAPATAELLDRVSKIEAICARHGVPLPAAALQFSMRDSRISSTIVGVSRPERVAESVDLATFPIPEAFWRDLRSIAPQTTDLD
jgi:D-threo-aldose 1-dehydrogenase